MLINTFDTDSVRIELTVIDQDTNAALDLTGATIVAKAVNVANPGVDIDGAVTVLDAANGVVRVDWAAGTFAVSSYKYQVRVTIGAEVQTVVSNTIAVADGI